MCSPVDVSAKTGDLRRRYREKGDKGGPAPEESQGRVGNRTLEGDGNHVPEGKRCETIM